MSAAPGASTRARAARPGLVVDPVVLRRAAAVLTAAAGAVHYAVVPAHRAEWWVAGLLFTLVGAVQLGWGVLAWQMASRRLLASGLAVNVAALAAWVVSRTSGLPVGPHAGVAEPVGTVDLVCAGAEAVAVVAVAIAVWSAAHGGVTAESA